MLLDQVQASSSREAFRYLEGERWISLTWQETKDKAFQLAAGLISLGVGPEDRVALASGTRMEWILADLAIMCAGAATTTIYPTTQHEDVAFILADSGSKVVIAEHEEQVAKVLDHLSELPDLVKIIQIDGRTDAEMVIGWAEFEELGRRHMADHPTAVDDAIADIRADQLATLIYTSGTTGRPRCSCCRTAGRTKESRSRSSTSSTPMTSSTSGCAASICLRQSADHRPATHRLRHGSGRPSTRSWTIWARCIRRSWPAHRASSRRSEPR